MLTGKYCEHLPLYRQSEIFARQGVELSRALLSNWIDACCQLMTPLNDALYRHVMNTRKVHTDDTPGQQRTRLVPLASQQGYILNTREKFHNVTPDD